MLTRRVKNELVFSFLAWVGILASLAAHGQTITSFFPTSGVIGTSVTITGTNFSATPASNIVYFGATRATVTNATATQLTVTVPLGATYHPITVTTGGLTAYSSAPFVVTFPGGGAIDANSFSALVDISSNSHPYGLAIGDLDGDGKADIVVTNAGVTPAISLIRNISTTGSLGVSSFSSRVDFGTVNGPFGVALGDIDGDGKLDIAVTGGSGGGNGKVSVFRNTTSTGPFNANSFVSKIDFPGPDDPKGIAIGDLDGDGKPEMVFTTETGVSVYKNTSIVGEITTGSFATKVDFPTGTTAFCVAISDLDADGKPDLVVANAFSGSASVLKNTTTAGVISASSFASHVDFVPIASPYGLSIGDLDGDGKPDFAVGDNGANVVSVFNNVGVQGAITASTFAGKVNFTAASGASTVAIGDLNGDGKPDMAVLNYGSNSISLFTNTTTPGPITQSSFAPRVDLTTGSVPRDLAIGDLDGDGKPDIVVSNDFGGTTSVFRNTIAQNPVLSITSFSPPSGPIGTSVVISGTLFDTTPANNIVKFNGTSAIVSSCTANSITTSVPSGASTGTITVTVGGQTAISLTNFTITSATAPTITSFTPSSGPVGTTVTITGTNFSPTPTNIVKFSGVSAVVTSNSATSLTTTVPAGATTGIITVTVGSETGASGNYFYLTSATAPTLVSFSPASGAVGTPVTITGTNFDLTPANNIVKFNGTAAVVTTSTSTTITAPVPAGATTGAISVTVAGQTATSSTNFNLFSSGVSRLGRFSVNQTSGCAPFNISLTNLSTGDCTAGKPCSMDYEGNNVQQQNQFTYTFTKAGTYKLTVLYQGVGADDITITIKAPVVTVSPSVTICSGELTTLKASGANTYSWSPTTGLSSTTGSSVIAKPTTTTSYSVTGTDIDGCVSTQAVSVNVKDLCSIPGLTSGKSIDAYNILSIPLKLSDTKIETVLVSAMQHYQGYDQSKWRLVHYSNGNNVNFTEGLSTIEQGKGYWLLSVDPLTINVSGTSINADQSTPFKMTLDLGWNQIGNPFGFDVSWSDVLAQNSSPASVGKLFVYDPSTVSFKESDNLHGWGGGFVNATAATTLNIPVTVNHAVGGKMSAPQIENNVIDQPSWFVPIKLQQGTTLNDMGGIGMHVDAMQSMDKYDENSLPRFVKYLELNSYHNEYFQPRFMRDIVPTSGSHNWTLTVESNFGDGEIVLTWDSEALSQNKAQLMLFDQETKMLLDMKKVGSYNIGSTQSRKLTIMYAADEKPLAPESVVIGQPYPNPFSSHTTIPIIIGQDDGEILISLYDMCGQKVKDMVANYDQGLHEITWNGEDAFGGRVNPGMYIVRVSGKNSPGTSMRVLAK